MPGKAPRLLSLPEDVLRVVFSAIMEPVDKLYSPLTAARCLALLAQTSSQLRCLAVPAGK